MKAINRRSFLGLLSAGWLAFRSGRTHAQPQQLDAQASPDKRPPEETRQPKKPPLEGAVWAADTENELEETYFWASDQQALFLQHVPESLYFQALLVDAGSGRKTLPEAFNARFSALLTAKIMHVRFADDPNRHETHYLPPKCALSPDGKRLVWLSQNQKWIAARLDAADKVEWPRAGKTVPGFALWMFDSRHWVECVEDYHNDAFTIPRAIFHDLEAPRANQTVQFTGLPDGLPLGITHDNHVLLYKQDFADRTTRKVKPQVDFYEASLDGESASVRDYSISWPQSMRVWDMALSRQGDRLAWRLMPDDLERATCEIWTSDLRGEARRKIGQVKNLTRLTGDRSIRSPFPVKLRWLPDGKRLSFLYDNALWTVPVD